MTHDVIGDGCAWVNGRNVLDTSRDLIPCRAGILDLRAIGTTARTIKLAGKTTYVVLNAVPPRASSILADALRAMLN